MPALAFLNGGLMSPEAASVPITDRGFLFGDAVYEVMRVYRGRIWLEDAHFDRLERSLDAVRMTGVDLGAVRTAAQETLARSGLLEATLYIQITRGSAPRKHAFPGPAVKPTVLVVAQPYDDGPTSALRANGVSTISHPDLRWGRCDIKSTNLLANVLANEAAHQAGAYEAILIDHEGKVTEATHSSLLWVRGGVVSGSPEGNEILPGTTRRCMLKLIQEAKLAFREERIDLPSLQGADEVLLAGTTIEVLPVVGIDGQLVGTGRPGPIGRTLQSAYQSAVQQWLAAEPLLRAELNS